MGASYSVCDQIAELWRNDPQVENRACIQRELFLDAAAPALRERESCFTAVTAAASGLAAFQAAINAAWSQWNFKSDSCSSLPPQDLETGIEQSSESNSDSLMIALMI